VAIDEVADGAPRTRARGRTRLPAGLLGSSPQSSGHPPSDQYLRAIEQVHIAGLQLELDETKRQGDHRRVYSLLILFFFCSVNLAVIFLVFHIFNREHDAGTERPVVTEAVLKLLVGATIVQLGGLAGGVGFRLFRSEQRRQAHSE
jgi:hypothetical protein